MILFLIIAFLFLPFHISSGIIGERLPIRYYLTVGMLASGLFTAMFGLGYFYNIHNLWFYIMAQVGTMLPRHLSFHGVFLVLYCFSFFFSFELQIVISG